MTAGSAQTSAASVAWTNAEPETLMERVLAPANLKRAYQRVVSNKGAPGADGMTVDQLAGYVKQYWPTLKSRLLAGEYYPQGVRAVEIPKPKGGTRQLGIPSVVDRLIQQALLQQLTPIFDPLFSDCSFGFRPGRSAHQAVESARDHVAAGNRWCVELDLEKFFDRVNHDTLMAHVQRHVEDKLVLKLIRRYLEAGAMSGGIASRRQEGTPQGGPLSPLLLNELDRELERRCHRFVRYADDAKIYVCSRRAGERVLAGVERFLNQRLKLTLNQEKSRVARPWVCDYLGYGMSWHKQPKLRVATERTARGILLDFTGQEFQANALIKVGDKKLKIAAKGLEQPRTLLSKVVVQGRTWSIIPPLKEINPAGTPLLYELQVRS